MIFENQLLLKFNLESLFPKIFKVSRVNGTYAYMLPFGSLLPLKILQTIQPFLPLANFCCQKS